MLHVFNVNYGSMLMFDVNLAMEKVLELKNAIASGQGVHQDKQVMLISGGQALCDDERVCSYAAGTETNPVYLFDKACIEKETLSLPIDNQQDIGFSDSIVNALSMSPSYKTVVARTKLAMRLNDATRRQVATMKSLVHDEHLMFQGWQAAVANLQETVSGFKDRVEVMCGQCHKMFQQACRNEDIMNGLDTVLENLEHIPVLPALLRKGGNMTPPSGGKSDEMFQISLLRWIETQCKHISIRSMLNECRQKQSYLSGDKYTTLLDECKKVESQTGNERMSEISGINERLAALDHLIISAEQQVKEQSGIAQGFLRNRDTARELHNNSSSIDALQTLCESHVTQLRLMHEYEASARDALKKCAHAKNELAANLHTRLRWLYFMQRSILNADVKLSMFTQQLCHLQRQVTFLDQVKHCPTLYLASVAEVVRRKHFANNYIKWANKAVSETQVERDREIVKRKTFQSNMAGHFIQRLFHGFSDKPPSLARKPLRSFDTKLPDITSDNLATLSQLLPAYKDLLQVLPSEKDTIEARLTMSTSTTQATSQISESKTTGQSSMIMDSSISFPVTSSVSMTTGRKEQDHVTSGSFAVVDSANIGQSQPGGFVVTSIEGVTQENMQNSFVVETREPRVDSRGDAAEEASQNFSFSPPAPPNRQLSQPSPSDNADSAFAQIGDIISPDSPPNSDFYSIMPGSFPFQQNSPNQAEIRRTSASSNDISSIDLSAKYDMSGGRTSSESYRSARKQSLLMAGSPDSNTSTSYQKVDGILSSDEEMFHSFTSDQGKDLKSMRKKLHQVQLEYDNLSDESRQEKEELNGLIRKLQDQIVSMEENQRRVELDYERRWAESKSELDDVIKQLENERIERKKAWMEGATLEKNLKDLSEACRNHETRAGSLRGELEQKKQNIKELENIIQKTKNESEFEITEAKKNYEHQLFDVKNIHEQESQTFKVTSARLERDLSLAQNELAASDDRIQELETGLSEQERKQEEEGIHALELEVKIKNLEEKLGCAQEELLNNQEEHMGFLKKIEESNGMLAKANEQVVSLKNILADYETKLNDDRTKDDLMKNLRGSLHQAEMEKHETTSELKSSREEVEALRENLTQIETEMQGLRSIAMQDERTHNEEAEKMRSTHIEELESVSKQYEEAIKNLTQDQEDVIQKMKDETGRTLQEKQAELDAKVEELKGHHRDEIDEIEADRLASIAAAQQSIEDLRSKLRDTHRLLDQEQKENLSLKESFAEDQKCFERECARLQDEINELVQKKSALDRELLESREVITNLEESRKLETASKNPVLLLGSSNLTSSTDDEMESKRSKIDSGISEDVIESFKASQMDVSTEGESDIMAMSMQDHKRAIGIMKKNFDEDKRALQTLFKKREEESARRRQMVFNSAIQRVSSSKDVEIRRLRGLLSSKSEVNPGLTQSMMAPTSQPMVPTLPRPHPSPPSSFDSNKCSPSLPTSPLSSTAAGLENQREKDKVTVANFQVGDTVLVSYNETYQHFTLLTTSRTLHFVHGESLDKLGISSAASEFKKSMTLATLVEKEYCQARKAQNRFRVQINTKFYRVKVVPLSKKEL